MRLDVGEVDGAIRNYLIEVLHHQSLCQDRQLVERAVGQSVMEPSVEGRASISVLAHPSELAGLVRLKLAARPAVSPAQ